MSAAAHKYLCPISVHSSGPVIRLSESESGTSYICTNMYVSLSAKFERKPLARAPGAPLHFLHAPTQLLIVCFQAKNDVESPGVGTRSRSPGLRLHLHSRIARSVNGH